MTDESKGKIFLAAERGHNETALLRSYSTFNFGNFFSPHKEALGDLYVWNDDTLSGGHGVKMHIDRNAYVIFIPIVGAIDYCDSIGNHKTVNAGEILLMQTAAGSVVEIKNPYEKELVNYLHLRIAADTAPGKSVPLVFGFDLNQHKNVYINITSGMHTGEQDNLDFKISMVKLGGRVDIAYGMKQKQGLFYAFVIEGALEVKGRLLHPRDGLALWDIETIDAEALSDDAILLTLELYERA